ncbi:hypothetical protein Tco_1280974 [Tanacetum coccineum]|uniref:DUF4283 domain-containing protein n=1 Tax=Tanacetum coccineum TaxID=301880 RepID=A0ABQ5EAI9_9ASTR
MGDHTFDWLRAVPISGFLLFSISKLCSTCSMVFAGDIYRDHVASCAGRDKPLRPADMLLYSWNKGLDVCVNLTGSPPLTQTGMNDFAPGRELKEDAITLLKRSEILVEINANKGYKDIIEIQYVDAQKMKKRAKTVQVEYQWKPISCNHCKMFGHGLIECKNMPKIEADIKMKRSERKEKTDLAGFEVVKNKKIYNYIDNLKKKSVEVQYRPKVNNTKNA